MVRGRTTTGFEYVVDERKAKDWELIEITARMQRAESPQEASLCVADIADFVLDKDQKERLKEHFRSLYGYVDAEKFSEAILEIVIGAKQSSELKNSSSSQPASQTARNASFATSPNITGFTTTDPSQQATQQPLQQASVMEAGSLVTIPEQSQ